MLHFSQEGRCNSDFVKVAIYGSEQDDSTGFNFGADFLESLRKLQESDQAL